MGNNFTIIELKRAREVIRDLYNENRAGSNNPNETVKSIVEVIGHDLTAATLASFVNSRRWDGRIRPGNKTYCENVPGALSEDDTKTSYFGLPDDIHPSHLDQLVSALRQIERESV